MTKPKDASPKGSEHADLQLVGDVVTELREHLTIIGGRRKELSKGSFDQDLATSAAALGKVLIAGAAERRAQRKASTGLSRETVMTWLASLDESDRNSIAREIEKMSSEEPLL